MQHMEHLSKVPNQTFLIFLLGFLYDVALRWAPLPPLTEFVSLPFRQPLISQRRGHSCHGICGVCVVCLWCGELRGGRLAAASR